MNTLHRKRGRRLLRRLRRTTGYSIAESLVAVLLVTLLSLGIATEMAFAGRHYRRTMIQSERQMLCSTLTDIIGNELRNTPKIRLASDGKLDSFYSRGYAHEETEMSRFYTVRIDEDMSITDAGAGAYGQLLLGNENARGELVGNLLLSGASYTAYRLQARTEVEYDDGEGLFHVTLSIRSPDGDVLTNAFDAVPLNDLQIEVVS